MPSGINPELDDLSLDELVERFRSPAPADEEYPDTYHMDVGYAIGDFGQDGQRFLRQYRLRADADQLRGVILGLSLEGSAENLRILRTFLSDERPLILADAVRMLALMSDRSVKSVIQPMLTNESPFVRSSAVDYLGRLFPNEARIYLEAALADPDWRVRMSGVDALDELDVGPGDALPRLWSMLADSHPYVRQAAQTAVDHWW